MADTISHLILLWMPMLLLMALAPLHAAAAQSTVMVTSRTITGTTTMTASAAPLTNCDGVDTCAYIETSCLVPFVDIALKVFCPTGTCYTGYDGFIGCCTV